jgi:hypothetical protein
MMKKILVATILTGALTACGTRLAGPYEQAHANQKACSSAGNIAAMAYQGKVEGKPSLEWMLADSAERVRNLPYPFPEIAQEAVRRGYAADSRTDAHMAAYSYCMDRMRR